MLKKISLFLAITTVSTNSALASELMFRVEPQLAQKSAALPKFYSSLLRATEHLMMTHNHITISFFKTDSGKIKLINATPFGVIFEDVSLPTVRVRSGDSFTIPCTGELGNSGLQVLEGNHPTYTAENVECGDIVYLHRTEEVQ